MYMTILHDYSAFFNSGSNISGIIKINFSIADVPYALIIFCQSGIIEVYCASLQVEPWAIPV